MKKAVAMANLQVDPAWPALTSEQILTGWRREFCVELRGEGQARIYLRAVETPSMKADELRRATLFHRVGAAFDDLDGCVAAAREPLEHLARTALRQTPSKDNLFAAVTYDRGAWDRVLQGIEQGSAVRTRHRLESRVDRRMRCPVRHSLSYQLGARRGTVETFDGSGLPPSRRVNIVASSFRIDLPSQLIVLAATCV